jgi:hypothetical protein
MYLQYIDGASVHALKDYDYFLNKTALYDDVFLDTVRGTGFVSYQTIPTGFLYNGALPNLGTQTTITKPHSLTIGYQRLHGVVLYTALQELMRGWLKNHLKLKVEIQFFERWLLVTQKKSIVDVYRSLFPKVSFLDDNTAVCLRTHYCPNLRAP